MEVRKSLRHSNSDSKLHYTHGYTNDYKLNIEKSLKKKLESTKRSDIIYEITRGGITVKLDAVSFELFVYACEQYYDINTVSDHDFRKTTATDKQGNNVQYTYHINRTRPEPKSFTINAYLTKCSLLINGKNCELFIDNDLDNIHHIMTNTKIDGAKINNEMLNQNLASKLQSALNVIKNSCSSVNNNTKEIEDEIEKCYKCKRPCKTKSVKCINGHWLHYACEKLTKTEISTVEDEKTTFVYTCKICQDINLKLPNPTIPMSSKCIANQDNLCLPMIRNIMSEEVDQNTAAKMLLLDELECNSCYESTPIVDNRCTSCELIFHTNCLQSSSEKCFNCVGIEDQNSEIDRDAHETIEKQVITTKQVSQDNEKTMKQNISQNEGSYNMQPQQKFTRTVLPKQIHISTAGANSNKQFENDSQISARMKELRQFEQKLKKKEEQIKIKETMINEDLKEKIRIMDRLHQSEMRNLELENTIKTLYTQIESLQQQSSFTQNYQENRKTREQNGEDEIVAGLRNRVTKFVLNRIDKELNKMESSADETVTIKSQCDGKKCDNSDSSELITHNNNNSLRNNRDNCTQSYKNQQQTTSSMRDVNCKTQLFNRCYNTQSDDRQPSSYDRNIPNKEGQPLYYSQNPQSNSFLYHPGLNVGRYK